MHTGYTQQELLEQAEDLISLLDTFIGAAPEEQDRLMVDLELFPHAVLPRPDIEPDDYGLVNILIPAKLDPPLADWPVPERLAYVKELRAKAEAWRQAQPEAGARP